MKPKPIPLEQCLAQSPPEPVSREQYQFYLVGRDVEARKTFVPISSLWKGLFPTYRKAKAYLDAHLEIRRRSPRKNRLEVHAGDWFRSLAQKVHRTEPSDAEIEAYLEGVQQRAKETRQRRK